MKRRMTNRHLPLVMKFQYLRMDRIVGNGYATDGMTGSRRHNRLSPYARTFVCRRCITGNVHTAYAPGRKVIILDYETFTYKV